MLTVVVSILLTLYTVAHVQVLCRCYHAIKLDYCTEHLSLHPYGVVRWYRSSRNIKGETGTCKLTIVTGFVFGHAFSGIWHIGHRNKVNSIG